MGRVFNVPRAAHTPPPHPHRQLQGPHACRVPSFLLRGSQGGMTLLWAGVPAPALCQFSLALAWGERVVRCLTCSPLRGPILQNHFGKFGAPGGGRGVFCTFEIRPACRLVGASSVLIPNLDCLSAELWRPGRTDSAPPPPHPSQAPPTSNVLQLPGGHGWGAGLWTPPPAPWWLPGRPSLHHQLGTTRPPRRVAPSPCLLGLSLGVVRNLRPGRLSCGLV